jgi:hypothetical protein
VEINIIHRISNHRKNTKKAKSNIEINNDDEAQGCNMHTRKLISADITHIFNTPDLANK